MMCRAAALARATQGRERFGGARTRSAQASRQRRGAAMVIHPPSCVTQYRVGVIGKFASVPGKSGKRDVALVPHHTLMSTRSKTAP